MVEYQSKTYIKLKYGVTFGREIDYQKLVEIKVKLQLKMVQGQGFQKELSRNQKELQNQVNEHGGYINNLIKSIMKVYI